MDCMYVNFLYEGEKEVKHIIKDVLMNYFTEIRSLVIEEELHINSWHTDLHYKIMVNGKRYSARFMNSNRIINPAFGALSNEQLKSKYALPIIYEGMEFLLCKLTRIRQGSHLH